MHRLPSGRRSTVEVPPSDHEAFARCEAVYEELPGWKRPTEKARTFNELPPAARRYLQRIAKLTGAKLAIVSVGPHRDQTIHL